MAYLLDANVFIEANRRHYGLDFCPAFWDWLIEQNAAGRIYSIENVSQQLEFYGDELAQWAVARGQGFFVKPDEAVLGALAIVSTWATSQNYEPTAIHAFLQDADYYIVAHAFAKRHTVVTHEIPSASVKKIKIPNACIGLHVKCMTPFEMLRREGARFVLGPQR